MQRTRFSRVTALFAAMALLLFALVPALAEEVPAELGISVDPIAFAPGQTVRVTLECPRDGQLDVYVADENYDQLTMLMDATAVSAGYTSISWDGTAEGEALAPGSYYLICDLDDESAEISVELTNEAVAETTVVESSGFVDGKSITPAHMSPESAPASSAPSYWETPMDISDEAAVWAMLTAPMTVVDIGQKEQAILRSEPDASSEGVGVVTGASQGLRVLETLDNGWSKVECYSSSFHDSSVKAWNAYVTGYIKTSRLKTVTPNQEYGLVIDKLTQMLYIFKDGHLYTTLAVSTGLANERQPYNETRSGEFLIISRVGDFKSDAMTCAMALRFNSGDLLHEVPYVLNADGSKSYKSTEYKLGNRGSHGCIRVQRLKNADGINMTWVWKNISNGTKLVIWEDYQFRQMDIPDSATALYYNPNGGSSYHSTANCNGVKDQYLPLTAFTYGELEDSTYASLDRCIYCYPPLRQSEIEAINQTHLETSPGMIEY